MMAMDGALRELAFNRAPLTELRAASRAGGMKTLLQDGRLKIRNGVTTPDELVRITQTAELVSG
jgi:type IV pilus assembly protein PilB